MQNIGIGGIIIIAIVALLVFGPNKLPELGRAFGRTLREFKNASQSILEDEPKPEPQPQRKEVGPVEEVKKPETVTSTASKDDRRLPD
ncbi:twin-arginine translocase TatA/TatE family subunit [Paenibacillus turpanensis]|uniref:twin-arginine translocase TatA/TatE family subunit n=1 Tax=Paenibacillus turpanensis TaxID=2689078 RepID=UPI00140C217E|nr:twin-arginine translocase TatA/TatE family subunit [Paenibacillus turpanensis]